MPVARHQLRRMCLLGELGRPVDTGRLRRGAIRPGWAPRGSARPSRCAVPLRPRQLFVTARCRVEELAGRALPLPFAVHRPTGRQDDLRRNRCCAATARRSSRWCRRRSPGCAGWPDPATGRCRSPRPGGRRVPARTRASSSSQTSGSVTSPTINSTSGMQLGRPAAVRVDLRMQAVQRDDGVPLADQPVGQRAADEPGPAGDHRQGGGAMVVGQLFLHAGSLPGEPGWPTICSDPHRSKEPG